LIFYFNSKPFSSDEEQKGGTGTPQNKKNSLPKKVVEEEEKEKEPIPKKSKKPPKKKKKKDKKKLDPEVLRQQFFAWKETDEYKKWVELSELKKEYPEITETSDDLTGKWQSVEDKIWAFSKCFKVKTKMKEFKHEHVRSFFFAREDKDNFQIDGVIAGLIKEHSDGAWHLRRKFVEIWKQMDDVHEFNEESFQIGRKKMSKDLTEFYKMMQL